MPTYEYSCRECGDRLEVVQSFTDDALTVCASCGGALRKVFSAAGIIFKGSGYYVNDTRGKGAKNPTAAPASADASSSGGDDGGSAKDGTSKDSTSKDGASKVASSSGSAAKEGTSSGGGSEPSRSGSSGPSSRRASPEAKSA